VTAHPNGRNYLRLHRQWLDFISRFLLGYTCTRFFFHVNRLSWKIKIHSSKVLFPLPCTTRSLIQNKFYNLRTYIPVFAHYQKEWPNSEHLKIYDAFSKDLDDALDTNGYNTWSVIKIRIFCRSACLWRWGIRRTAGCFHLQGLRVAYKCKLGDCGLLEFVSLGDCGLLMTIC